MSNSRVAEDTISEGEGVGAEGLGVIEDVETTRDAVAATVRTMARIEDGEVVGARTTDGMTTTSTDPHRTQLWKSSTWTRTMCPG